MRKSILIILTFLLFPAVLNAAVVSRPSVGSVRVNVPTNTSLLKNLAAHWTLDGPDMLQNVTDISGNGRSAYLVNTATTSVVRAGVLGQALNFDGVNDAIAISPAITLGSTFSVAMWIKPTAFPGPYNNLITGAGGIYGWWIRNSGATHRSDYYEGGDHDGNTDIVAGVWQHLAIVCAATSCTHYYNGVADGTNSFTVSSFIPDRISTDSAANQEQYTGLKDDIRLYSRALSAAEVKAIYNLGAKSFVANSGDVESKTEGLNGWWTFNGPELTATAVADKSGNGNGGTLNGFPSLPTVAPGKSGQALLFDGVDDNVSLGDTNESGTITLTAWVKPAAVKGSMKIISKKMSGASAQYGIGTAVTNTDKFTSVFFSSAPSSDVCESSGTAGTYTANQWYFVAAAYDGNTCYMYVNGVDVTNNTSDIAAGDILNTTSTLRIGADGGSSPAASSYWSGVIDEPRIYGRVLSAAEILRLYNMGR